MIDIMTISGEKLFTVPILNDAVAREELMTDDYVRLSWNSDKGDMLPVGASVVYGGERYSLLKPYYPTRVNEIEFRYTPQFDSRIVRWKKLPVPVYTYASDGETVNSREFDWTFTGTPSDAMSMVQRAIKHETGEVWTFKVDEGLAATITIASESASIWSVLSDIAEQCETEWWTEKSSNKLHLGKCIHGAAIPLEVGRNVQIPSVTENNDEYYTRFYALGSTRNITQDARVNNGSVVSKRLGLDPVKYPNGYKDIKGHFENGVFVSDLKPEVVFPTSLYFEDVYTSSKLAINSVRKRLRYRLDEAGNKIITGGTEENPVYDQYAIWYFQLPNFTFTEALLIEGLELSVHFKSGQLRGREFALAYHAETKKVADADDVDKEFTVQAGDYEIIFDEQSSGFIIPSVDYIIPQNGDEVTLFNIEMPSEYVDSAYVELESKLDEELERRSKDNNSYEFNSNPIAFYEDNTNITLGQAVSFANNGAVLDTRVLMVEKHLDYSFDQRIRVGNTVILGSRQQLRGEVENIEKEVEQVSEQSIQYTKRRYRDAQETIGMLEAAMLEGFTESISPITIRTMSMLVGNESLQFRFVNGKTNPTVVTPNLIYDKAAKVIKFDGGTIQHMTLGINAMSPSHKPSEFKYWTVSANDSISLAETGKPYYLYIMASKTSESASLIASPTAIEIESVAGYYHFLTAIANSEVDGDRSIVFLNGFTEILPSQITTDVIRDAEGKLIIDLNRATITAQQGATIVGDIELTSGSKGLENLQVWKDLESNISGVEETLEQLKDQIDGVVENYFLEGTPTTTTPPVTDWLNGVSASDRDAVLLEHVGDTYTNISTTDETAGYSWRWCECTNIEGVTDYIEVSSPAGKKKLHWHRIADTDAIKALEMASKAQATADGKRRVFVSQPYGPYDEGDLWANNGELMLCITPTAKVNYFSAADWDKATKYTDGSNTKNLLPNSAEVVTGESQYYHARILLPVRINGGEEYTFKCDSSVLKEGSDTTYKVFLANDSDSTQYTNWGEVAFGKNKEVTLKVNDTVNGAAVANKMAWLVIHKTTYPSSTNKAVFNNISLVKSSRSMPSWENYQGDYGLDNILKVGEQYVGAFNKSFYFSENLSFNVNAGETYAFCIENLEVASGTAPSTQYGVRFLGRDTTTQLTNSAILNVGYGGWGVLTVNSDVSNAPARIMVSKGGSGNSTARITRFSLVKGTTPMMVWKENSNTLKEKVASWASDGAFSPTEITGLESERKRIEQEKLDINAQYNDAFGNTSGSVLSDYNAAYGNYYSDLTAVIDAYNKATDKTAAIGVPSTFDARLNSYYEMKTAVVKVISAKIKGNIDAIPIAVANDFGYLKTAFVGIKEANILTGDVFLGQMMGVGANNGNGNFTVNAFMNGNSAFSGGSSEGKLMLATGIPETGGTLAERSKMATTQIYELGKIVTKLIEANGGNIGHFVIKEDGTLSIVDDSTEAEMFLTERGIVFYSKGAMSGKAPYASLGNGCEGNVLLQLIADPTRGTYCHGSAANEHVAMHVMSDKAAIFCDEGMYYGFRPKTHVVNAASELTVNLTEFDHTEIASGRVNYVLPAQPKNGQCYRIIKTLATGGATLTASGSATIYDLISNSSKGTTYSLPTNVRMFEIVWDGNSKWYVDGIAH